MATLRYPQYNLNSLTRLGNRFARSRTGAALDLQTGRRSPWELPEWRPTVEGYQGEYSRGLGDLARNFNRAGVSGPAAGLGMERANDAYSGGLLQLPQQIRQSYTGEGWQGAALGERKRQFDRGQALQRYGMEGNWDLQREMQDDPNFWDKYGGQILGGAGGLASMFASGGAGFNPMQLQDFYKYLMMVK